MNQTQKRIQDFLSSKKQIQFWTLEEIKTQRKEFYLCAGASGSEANQSRKVSIHEGELEIWLQPSGEGRIGFSKGRLDFNANLEAQMETLIANAGLASEEAWGPEAASRADLAPTAKLCAHQFLEDFDGASENLRAEFQKEIDEVTRSQFNSAELFCSLSLHERLSSNGFHAEFHRSKIYAEVCFSSSNGSDSQEFMETRWAVRPEDIPFREMCLACVQGSQGLLKAAPTPAGTYWARLHDQDLALILYSCLRGAFSGAHKYRRLPFMEKGSSLIPEFAGQSFRVSLNPTRDFGLNSLGFDSWGREEKELLLAEDNQVKGGIYSQKTARYLQESPTATQGVLEIVPLEEEREAPESYLEILQFSGLFVDEMSLTFSSEIRLAKWHQAGREPVFVKGGNFSGSLKENFARVQWAPTGTLVGVEGEGSVFVPRHADLNAVSVS